MLHNGLEFDCKSDKQVGAVKSCEEFGGLYGILEMIDYGSFGDIFKVKNESDNKTYAMKQVKFRNNFHDDPYIMSEIYCLTNLKHKNIIQLHEIVVDINELHFFMEYATNENLERYLHEHQDMDFHQRYKIYSQVLQGLQYCHSMDVAHRDLTPANILLTDDLVVKLADFGLSVKCFKDDGSPLLCRDYTGHVTYLPPEVLAQTPFLPKPADIWSVGICLVYILFLIVPYEDFSNEDILAEQMQHSPKQMIKDKLQEHLRPINPGVENVIDVCLCVKPNERRNICDLVRLWDEVSSESLYDTFMNSY